MKYYLVNIPGQIVSPDPTGRYRRNTGVEFFAYMHPKWFTFPQNGLLNPIHVEKTNGSTEWRVEPGQKRWYNCFLYDMPKISVVLVRDGQEEDFNNTFKNLVIMQFYSAKEILPFFKGCNTIYDKDVKYMIDNWQLPEGL